MPETTPTTPESLLTSDRCLLGCGGAMHEGDCPERDPARDAATELWAIFCEVTDRYDEAHGNPRGRPLHVNQSECLIHARAVRSAIEQVRLDIAKATDDKVLIGDDLWLSTRQLLDRSDCAVRDLAERSEFLPRVLHILGIAYAKRDPGSMGSVT